MDLQEYLDLPTEQSGELSLMLNQIATLEKIVKEAKEQEKQLKEMKEQLYESMLKNNVKKWETPSGIKSCLVEEIPPTKEEYKKFCESDFRRDHKDLWEQYLIDAVEEKPGKKGYVRITLPKE